MSATINRLKILVNGTVGLKIAKKTYPEHSFSNSLIDCFLSVFEGSNNFLYYFLIKKGKSMQVV